MVCRLAVDFKLAGEGVTPLSNFILQKENKMTEFTLTEKICDKCQKYFESMNPTASLCLECLFPKVEVAKNQSIEVIIRPELIDTSKLQSAKLIRPYRPDTFDSYIGQQPLKDILNGYIAGSKKHSKTFPHFLVDGKAGTGKTAIAYILAKQLGLNFIECVANSINSKQQFIDKLVEVKGGIFFIDEIHMINKQLANFILPIMEDFQINGQSIPSFSIFSATTEKGILLKNFKPLVDRFKIQKTLDAYSIEELTKLITQYKNKVFNNIDISQSTLEEIAKNCRSTPRTAIRLLESLVYMEQPIQKIFKSYNIVKNGVTENDIKLLGLLQANKKGLGLTSICAYLQTSKENYIYSMESYLLEQGYIAISNNRQITDAGRIFLTSL